MYKSKSFVSVIVVLIVFLLSGNVYANRFDDNDTDAFGRLRLFNNDRNTGAVIADFSLDTPFNVVAAVEDDEAQTLAKNIVAFLKSHGNNNAVRTNSLDKRNIILSKANDLEDVSGSEDIYSMRVTKNSIILNFTSTTAMYWAYGAFVSHYTEKQNFFQKLMKKKKSFIKGIDVVENSGDDTAWGILDLVHRATDIASVRKDIQGCLSKNVSTVYMVFISPRGFKVESDVLKMMNPSGVLCSGGGYTYDEINEIYLYAKSKGVEIIPVFDFATEENPAFFSYTGHNVHSVEGLRFSRAFLKEFMEKTSFPSVCLGKEPEDVKVREKYINPLADVINAEGKSAVVQ